MTVFKIGTDICSLQRIAEAYERFGQRFLNRIFTPDEFAYILSQPPHTVARIAGRFAAKEAASKTLGTGWRGVSWKEIEIVRRSSGEPTIRLHGRAIEIAKQRGLETWEVSFSHEREFATASVIAYGSGGNGRQSQ